MTIMEAVNAATAAMRDRLDGRKPRVGVILGSGLTPAKLPLSNTIEIPTAEIPGLPVPTVAGHRAIWTAAELGSVEILIAGGRSHAYEGVSLAEATLGVRVMRRIGCESIVVTNAAGGIDRGFTPGTLMRIRDHLNLLGRSPLVGDHDDELGQRFVDMTNVYDAEWGERAKAAAQELGIELQEGVYAACLGPQYETPSEIRMLETLGANAVGMSTVPEVIVARQEGLRIFGLSLISNAAAGISENPLSHQEVLEAGEAAAGDLARLLERVVAL